MLEAWLRGPVEGVPRPLMPAAHSLIDAVEDIESAVTGLRPEELWLTLGNAASIGFHLKHIPGSLERLLTYAEGRELSGAQLAALREEGYPGEPPAGLDDLFGTLQAARDRTLDAYRHTAPESLHEARAVGRAALPSMVLGLLFHAAEHARRHAGQVVATARIIQGLDRCSDGCG